MHQAPATNPPRVPHWSPPGWLNTLVIRLLRMPGIQRLPGRWIALITVKGRATGNLHTTPVSYLREDGTLILMTKRSRSWWRNLRDNPRLVLRLAGRNVRGIATILDDDVERLATLISFLESRRLDAPAYGLSLDPDGHINPDEARAILPQIVVMRVLLVDGETVER